MAVDSLGGDTVALVSPIVPPVEREAKPVVEEEKERRERDAGAVTPSIRPSDETSSALFGQRLNEDQEVSATVAALRYQTVQEARKPEQADQPADQQKPQAIAAAQGAGTFAAAAMVRPPENPQSQPIPIANNAQAIGAAVRVKA